MQKPAPLMRAVRHENASPRSYSVRFLPRSRTWGLATVLGVVFALVGSALVGVLPGSTATAAPTSYTIWPSTTVPTVKADPDRSAVEVGVKFTTSSTGWITAIRYYKGATNTGPHTGHLWSSDGRALAAVGFKNETASGWQQANLGTPVQVQAGGSYTASYFAPVGRYAGDVNALSSAKPKSTYALKATQGVYSYTGGMPRSTWQNANYYVDVVFSSTKPATATPKPSTTTATPKPTPTSTPTSSPPPSAGWPAASNTGWTGTLSPYTGPCTIQTANFAIRNADVKAKCSYLLVQAKGVTINNSRLPRVESTYLDGSSSVSIADSTVEAGSWSEGAVWGYNINIARSEITGGQHSVHANNNVTVTDSWLHGQYNPAGQSYHNNAFITNGGYNMTVRHNTLHCTAILNSTDGGCTADVSLFGDFDPVTNVLIENNLLKANNSSISYCAYGGYQPTKRYPVATTIRYVDNVFERGANSKCGVYGPVTSFQSSASGNVWSGNKFQDGTVIKP